MKRFKNILFVIDTSVDNHAVFLRALSLAENNQAMGNTAETILSRVECSVLAVKPGGFVSPVNVDED